MRQLAWLALLAPMSVLAANPQVQKNTKAIKMLWAEQVIQNQRPVRC